jgi:hypothetical protein
MEVKCGSVFTWSENFEKKKEGQWAEERDQSSCGLKTLRRRKKVNELKRDQSDLTP